MLMASAALSIEGGAHCPTPSEVMSRLDGLLPADVGFSRTATIENRVGEVHLTLHDAVGTVLASKVIRARPLCSELAEISAVVLAAWEAEFAERAPELPEASQSPDVPRARVSNGKTNAAAPDGPTQAEGLEFGGGPLVSLAPGQGWGGGGVIQVSYLPEGGRWGAELYVLLASGTYSVSNDPAHDFSVLRVGAGMGPRFRIIDRAIRLDVHAALMATSLTRGHPALATSSFDTGLIVGARALLAVGAWKPWLGFTVSLWPTLHPVPVPILETAFCLGGSFGAPN